MKTFDEFVFPDLSGSVIAHDRYQNYDAIPGVHSHARSKSHNAIGNNTAGWA
jgi:hypothetical protein